MLFQRNIQIIMFFFFHSKVNRCGGMNNKNTMSCLTFLKSLEMVFHNKMREKKRLDTE